MTPTTHKGAALTAASALAMYDAAGCGADKARAAAAMAEVLRRSLAKAPKKKDAGPTDLLTAANLIVTMKRLCAVVEKRSGIPILACVLLESKAGRLTLSASDLDALYVETLRAPGLPPFSMAVPADALAKALRGATGDVVFTDATVHPEPGATVRRSGHKPDAEGKSVWTSWDEPARPDLFLTVAAGGMETLLPGMPAADFPIMLTPRNGETVLKPTASAIMPSARLLEPLKFVRPAVSEEETCYYMNGVYMHVIVDEGVGRLRFVATDGIRLLLDSGEDTGGFRAGMPGMIIPRKAVDWIIRNVRDEELQLDVWPQQIRLTTATGCYQTKLIDGNFPDYQRVIPKEENATVIGIPEPAVWVAGLEKLAAQAGEKSAGVTLACEGGKVMASSRSLDGRKAVAELPAELTGRDQTIRFNGRFLVQVLAQNEVAVMGFDSPNAPALITWPEMPGRSGIIMPLRV